MKGYDIRMSGAALEKDDLIEAILRAKVLSHLCDQAVYYYILSTSAFVGLQWMLASCSRGSVPRPSVLLVS